MGDTARVSLLSTMLSSSKSESTGPGDTPARKNVVTDNHAPPLTLGSAETSEEPQTLFQTGEELHYLNAHKAHVTVRMDSVWTTWDSKTFYKLYKEKELELLTNYASSEDLHKPGTQNNCELCKQLVKSD